MKDSKTTFERRIEMLFFLMKHRKTTVAQLAEIFSVHRNTAYKDIIFLSRYAPIYTKLGVGGGIYLLEHYRNDLFLYLSTDEESVLKSMMDSLETKEKIIVGNIINKFSMPRKGT